MVNCSSSLGLFIICAALDLHLVMKAKKNSFDSCFMVSKSHLVTSTSMLYLYWLWNLRQMSSQLLSLASSRLKNHLRATWIGCFGTFEQVVLQLFLGAAWPSYTSSNGTLGSQSRRTCPRLASWTWEVVSHQGKVRVIGSPWGLPSCELSLSSLPSCLFFHWSSFRSPWLEDYGQFCSPLGHSSGFEIVTP